MPSNLSNLLRDPVFTVRAEGGQRRRLSLPEILASLCSGDEITSFEAIQVHQQHAWFAFLVQMSAIALARADADQEHSHAPPKRWIELLLALTGGREEPWQLIVEDLSAPAFFQPPVPEGTLTDFKNRARTPDGLDILQTAKNHDVKSRRIVDPEIEHWVYALVTLQTMQGFSGARNYGIARMNGGFSNRPAVSFTPGHSFSATYRRDLATLLECRPAIVADYEYPDSGGYALLWLEPWDGNASLPVASCDPWFIEVCRRVRLVWEGAAVVGRLSTSTVARVAAKELNGNTGDPWTPVDRAKGTALTVSGSGFSYPLMHRLILGGDFRPGAAGTLRDNDAKDMLVSAKALVRGQGQTDGYHTRLIPLPRKAQRYLVSEQERSRLGEIAQRRTEMAATLRRAVLGPALCALLQGAPDRLNLRDERRRPWQDRADREIDAHFFSRLFTEMDLAPEESDRLWALYLVELGRRLLTEATNSVPLPGARRYRAIAAAERVYEGSARKHLAAAFEKSKEMADVQSEQD